MEQIGKNIQARRKIVGITQDELGKQMGVSKSQISNWERGKASPTLSEFTKMSEILNIPPQALFEGKVEEEIIENKEQIDTRHKVIVISMLVLCVLLVCCFGIQIYKYFAPQHWEEEYQAEIIYQKPLEDGVWEVRQLVRRYDDTLWADVVIHQKDGKVLDGEVLEITDSAGRTDVGYKTYIGQEATVFLVIAEYLGDEQPRIVIFQACAVPIE